MNDIIQNVISFFMNLDTAIVGLILAVLVVAMVICWRRSRVLSLVLLILAALLALGKFILPSVIKFSSQEDASKDKEVKKYEEILNYNDDVYSDNGVVITFTKG